jgi:aspartate ammonia-lyase
VVRRLILFVVAPRTRVKLMLTATERIEHDLLGDLAVPAAAYYGVHTLRALENFPITGIPISVYPNLVNAMASVKEAAAPPTMISGS